MIPNKINITTDGSVLQFVDSTLKDSKGVKLATPHHNYQYTKSKEKKGQILSLTEKQIEDLIVNQKLFKPSNLTEPMEDEGNEGFPD